MKFTSYGKCVDYLFSLERVGIKYDLNNIKKLTGLSDNPHKKFKSIHIAGTNGKGSTASIIASVLKESKYKVGLYTSPHISDFRERIRVNGKTIPKDYVIDYTNRLYKDIEKIKPSFFEVTTAMAFKYFADKKVDFAVIECGLGGRLDSTNILQPVVSVITSISIDHTEYLGNTIKSITYEKAGIIKRYIPCVTGNLTDYQRTIVRKVCRYNKSELIESDAITLKSKFISDKGYEVSFLGEKMILPLFGKYQLNNVKTAFAVLFYLIGENLAETGLSELKIGLAKIEENTGYDYRFRIINDNPKIILDVSHNADGLSKLKESLKMQKYGKLIVIFGMMFDKEIGKCINELEKLNGFMIFTKPDYKRAGEPKDFAAHLSRKSKYVIKNNVKESYEYAKALAKKDDLILITGSFFMVSDFLKFINGND
ncbi:MAG: bifunctional folylpolyglutamate synthase/dihydrofolate synthase [Ignavibacteria bacterium]